MPKPEVRWIKQGIEIKNSQEYQIEELEEGHYALIIPEVYQDDTGDIVFEAYNPLGVVQTVTALSVEGILNHELLMLLFFSHRNMFTNDTNVQDQFNEESAKPR